MARFSLVAAGAAGGATLALSPRRPLRIGRRPDCDLVLTNQKSSSWHCELRIDGGAVVVTDMSSNGTFVEGVRIGRGQTRVMQPGETLTFLNPCSHDEAGDSPTFRLHVTDDTDGSCEAEGSVLPVPPTGGEPTELLAGDKPAMPPMADVPEFLPGLDKPAMLSAAELSAAELSAAELSAAELSAADVPTSNGAVAASRFFTSLAGQDSTLQAGEWANDGALPPNLQSGPSESGEEGVVDVAASLPKAATNVDELLDSFRFEGRAVGEAEVVQVALSLDGGGWIQRRRDRDSYPVPTERKWVRRDRKRGAERRRTRRAVESGSSEASWGEESGEAEEDLIESEEEGEEEVEEREVTGMEVGRAGGSLRLRTQRARNADAKRKLSEAQRVCSGLSKRALSDGEEEDEEEPIAKEGDVAGVGQDLQARRPAALRSLDDNEVGDGGGKESADLGCGRGTRKWTLGAAGGERKKVHVLVDSGSEDGDEYTREKDSRESKQAVARALAECERVSLLIREELSKMAQAAADGDVLSMTSFPSLSQPRSARQKPAAVATSGSDGIGGSTAMLLSAPRKLAVTDSRMLKEYQLVGLNWLWLMWRFRFGGILADEMGLGKTVQVIALLSAILEAEGDHHARAPHLVVAPASTLDNWVREFSEWAPSMRTVKYHGGQSARCEIREEADETGFDVLLTTYSYFEGEGSSSREDRRWLRKQSWGVAVLDEAHALKSCTSSRFQRLSQITTQQRLLLTGTPIQNNLEELLSLLSFMLPGLFPPQLCAAFARSSQAGEEQQVRRARRMLAPFILRRKKCDVLNQLAPKHEEEARVQMLSRQRTLYNSLLADAKQLRSKLTRKATTSLFFDLRKAANHPCLLRTHYTPNDLSTIATAALKVGHFGRQCTLAMVEAELASYSDYRLHEVCMEINALRKLRLTPTKLYDSAKLKALERLLPQLNAEGHRALIFSQSTQMLDLLEDFFDNVLHLSFVRLDGSTPVSERQELIDAFQQPDSPVFAFLLSTRAGGQGINLTAADTVIIHDLDWNPQLDRQAEDRAHRIGQTREVRVIRMVTADTVEENILNLQQRKKSLDAKVLDGDLDGKRRRGNDPTVGEEGGLDDCSKLDFKIMNLIIEQALAAEAHKAKDA